MMELITKEKSFSHLKEKAFLTGILSNLDAILNLPMADIVKSFLFSSDIKLALSEQQGELSELLTLAKHYEVSTSKRVTRCIDSNKISETRLLNCYYDALKWGVNIF
jgi:EAL and modified HD-GYP domain-containing signal transduction protein